MNEPRGHYRDWAYANPDAPIRPQDRLWGADPRTLSPERLDAMEAYDNPPSGQGGNLLFFLILLGVGAAIFFPLRYLWRIARQRYGVTVRGIILTIVFILILVRIVQIILGGPL